MIRTVHWTVLHKPTTDTFYPHCRPRTRRRQKSLKNREKKSNLFLRIIPHVFQLFPSRQDKVTEEGPFRPSRSPKAAPIFCEDFFFFFLQRLNPPLNGLTCGRYWDFFSRATIPKGKSTATSKKRGQGRSLQLQVRRFFVSICQSVILQTKMRNSFLGKLTPAISSEALITLPIIQFVREFVNEGILVRYFGKKVNSARFSSDRTFSLPNFARKKAIFFFLSFLPSHRAPRLALCKSFWSSTALFLQQSNLASGLQME